ncbi:SRPBCC domain-containing protein [Chitinophaga pinensis]|uniref:Activator of Hsp90 ATPase 1 family protein n=1 Tax=Chitinophaga pinensis (strain ATCC 43595 / DSM 2588 / LMG 13176 / NBRC 15968 / NCIMB 11800 / UQM 2034) TaxID=485918 RepID=A0A979GTE1_CHIPD|nr:SRPBCC domain-containing protein [Chitinophaga pinensis]ACU62013.1 Activator of Hsp90 ATPase 1 family protein [Chitinophaga pinensis DSM 2588]
MSKAILFDFVVDKENNRIKVDRSFDAPLDLVWTAWTDAEILDQWWAPKPYRAETKSMDFREGGRWHYAMVGPEGDKQWCLFDYETIQPEQSYSGIDAFCDENGILNPDQPRMRWNNRFNERPDNTTVVNIEVRFNQLSDLETILQMGFKEGFSMGLENLDAYISAQFYLRKQKKPGNKARVSFYLNFPGNTEEALFFYKSVFKTDFVNGIQRFGDIPADAGNPPIAEPIKKMVLHAELPLIGGAILMATDAPKEMGFNLTQGNNMHINLEPESREEALRIFEALSEGGEITMPLQDMFWGAYYGSFKDKYGINWMVNYQQAN